MGLKKRGCLARARVGRAQENFRRLFVIMNNVIRSSLIRQRSLGISDEAADGLLHMKHTEAPLRTLLEASGLFVVPLCRRGDT